MHIACKVLKEVTILDRPYAVDQIASVPEEYIPDLVKEGYIEDPRPRQQPGVRPENIPPAGEDASLASVAAPRGTGPVKGFGRKPAKEPPAPIDADGSTIGSQPNNALSQGDPQDRTEPLGEMNSSVEAQPNEPNVQDQPNSPQGPQPTSGPANGASQGVQDTGASGKDLGQDKSQPGNSPGKGVSVEEK